MALEKNRGSLPVAGSTAVVVGAGRSGIAVAKLLARMDVKTHLLEKNPDAVDDAEKRRLAECGVVTHFGEHNQRQFANASLVIPSPGIAFQDLQALLGENRPEIISEMEMACRCLGNEPILAVTGTSGKTTTVSLAAAMLKTQGYSVFLGGNIGTPLSEYVLSNRKADVLVLECSSFQLHGCSTFCPRVAVLLNVSPNHLDHHKDMREYVDAKFRIFRCQEESDLAIFGPGLESIVKKFHVPARKLFIKDEGRFNETRLFGKHNALNAETAWQAVRFFGVSLANAQKAAAKFLPLAHRLENLGEVNGVLYVNDSKCTTVAALKVALEAFDRPVRLLAGGKFKGGDLGSLASLLKEKVAEVSLFGGSREYFEQAWTGIVPISWHPTLREAVARLRGRAVKGDVILLAPATSSYDQYKNYQARGEDFRNIVSGLA